MISETKKHLKCILILLLICAVIAVAVVALHVTAEKKLTQYEEDLATIPVTLTVTTPTGEPKVEVLDDGTVIEMPLYIPEWVYRLFTEKEPVLFYDVSNDALKQMVKDTYNAFVRFFKKESKYPNRKTYKDNHKSFYVDPYKIRFTDSKVKLEKISNNQKVNRQVLNYVPLAEKSRIPTNVKYYNPRVVYDGYRFYIVVSVDDIHYPIKKKKELEDKTIGIDLNISSIVTSENKVYVSINKEKHLENMK